MRISLALVALALLLNACVIERPTNRSGSIAREAHAAQLRSDWVSAAQLWEQAIRVEKGIWSDPELANSPKLMAVYYYELGRSLGVLGQYEDSERDLLQALRLDKKFNGPIGMDLIELARLNHARGDNVRAASFFDQVIPRADEISEKDPAGYVAMFNEAASVAKALGQNERAAELEAKAAKVSVNHPNLKFPDDYSWTPYKMSEVKK
jgi:tetratricopeptide (TPR) repeat protein